MEIKKRIKTEWWLLFLIILLSCSLQALSAIRNKVPEFDEAIHYDLALNIVKTGLPIRSDGWATTYFHHPFLTFYLMAIPLHFSFSLFWGRILGTVCSVLIILATYLLGKKIGGSKTGLIAAFLLAIHPLFLTFGHSFYVEPYHGFFVMASVVLFLLAEERKKDTFYLLAGIFLGLAFLTKYLAAVLALSYFVFFFLNKRQKVLREKKLYLVLLPAGAIFLFWPIFGYLVDWPGFLEAVNLWRTYGKVGPCDARVGVGFLRHILGLGLGLSPPFALAGFLAFVFQGSRLFRKRNLANPQVFILIFISFWFLSLFLIVTKDTKYLFPILPFMAVVLAKTVGTFRLTLKGLILALIFLVLFSPYDFFNLRKSPLNMRLYFSFYMWRIEKKNGSCFKLGEYLRSVSKEDEVIFYDANAAVGGFCSQRPYRTIGCSLRYKQVMEMLDEANIVVVGPEVYFPYLTQEEKQKFFNELENEFFLAKTFPRWGRVFIKKGKVG